LKNDSNTSEPKSNELTIVKQEEKKPQHSPKSFFIIGGLLIFFVGLGFGFLFGVSQNYPAEKIGTDIILNRNEDHTSADVDFKLFWEAWDYLRTNYVDQPVNEQDLLYGAISGLVSSLPDHYSTFFNPAESKEFLEEINGNFEGIGAEIGIRKDLLTVIAPLAGSPAEKAGLLAGDNILAIDDLDTSAMSLYEAVQKIRGDKDTEVKLTILREGAKEAFDLSIKREVIKIESVKSKVVNLSDKNIAIITITNFNSDTTQKFQEAVNSLLLEEPQGIILDLRNNPGGFLLSAIDIASKFIPEGKVVVWRQDSTNEDQALLASGASPLTALPVVVLLDKGSASASEILAAALQDQQQAVLIGENSFGKGTVQDVKTFADGSTLKLTISRWLTPNKKLIEEKGVAPDYLVERTVKDIDEDRDPQLAAAKMYFTDKAKFDQKYQKNPDLNQENNQENN